LGSPIRLLGNDNSEAMAYDEFGVLEISASTHNFNNPFGFTGYQTDKISELYYAQARYYSPTSGRFFAEDPIKDRLNWYGYCNANPVAFVDPTGLAECPGVVCNILGPMPTWGNNLCVNIVFRPGAGVGFTKNVPGVVSVELKQAVYQEFTFTIDDGVQVGEIVEMVSAGASVLGLDIGAYAERTFDCDWLERIEWEIIDGELVVTNLAELRTSSGSPYIKLGNVGSTPDGRYEWSIGGFAGIGAIFGFQFGRCACP